MSEDIQSLVSRLDEGRDSAREAATRLTSISDDRPDEFGPVVEQLVDALERDDRAIRVDVSYVLFNVSIAAPESLVDHAARMAPILDDAGRKTRINLARALAEVAFVDPAAGSQMANRLFRSFPGGHDHYRHSVAWAMEAIAPLRPELVREQLDRCRPLFDDGYRPVVKHLARVFAMIERSSLGLQATATPDRRRHTIDTLSGYVGRDDKVGQAAALALGAIGTARTADVLASELDTPGLATTAAPQDGVLRVAYRDAVGGGPYTEGLLDEPVTALTDGRLSVGDWIAFEGDEMVPPGGALFGRIEELMAPGARSAPAIGLYNPLFRYRARVRLDLQQARYSDPWRTRSIPLQAEQAARMATTPTSISLLAPGDRIQVELDGRDEATYRVTQVDHDGDRSLIATTEDGPHELEIRPTTAPARAIFDGGLALQVTEADILDSTEVDVSMPDAGLDRLPLR